MSGFVPAEVAAGYDKIAREYAAEFADEFTRKPFDRELLEDFAVLVGGRGVVCDLGCGPGNVARFLADHDVPVLGVDLSKEMVAVARERNPDITFVHGDARVLEVADGALAGIVAFYSLVHLRRDELGAVAVELHRTLAPSGLLLIAIHGGVGEIHVDALFNKPVDFTATLFERDELADVLHGAGFTVEQAVQRPPYDFEVQTPHVYVLARRG